MQHRARWNFALFAGCVLSLSGCGSDSEPSGPCPPGSTLTYGNFGKAFVDSYCVGCHGGSVTGAARQGAPADEVFDTRAQIAASAGELDEQVVVMKSMPFGPTSPKPTDDQRAQFGEWLACGAPE
jgi:uncharacterized membrane protein